MSRLWLNNDFGPVELINESIKFTMWFWAVILARYVGRRIGNRWR